MNKQLFEKVKSLCKDTGLSEKYLRAITERIGGSVEDDSTDEAAIGEAANLVADVAKESQGEATRWASVKGKGKKTPKKDDDSDGDDDPDDDVLNEGKGKRRRGDDDPNEDRLKALEEKLAKYEADEARGKRSREISDAFEKHKIPVYLRGRLAKSISDDEDLEEAVSALKQEMITNGLITEGSEGSKSASAKQIDEAADDLLRSITV